MRSGSGAPGGTGGVVAARDVGLELAGLDPPLPTAADLDADQLVALQQGSDLADRDVQDLRNVGDLQEPLLGHLGTIPHVR